MLWWWWGRGWGVGGSCLLQTLFAKPQSRSDLLLLLLGWACPMQGPRGPRVPPGALGPGQRVWHTTQTVLFSQLI